MSSNFGSSMSHTAASPRSGPAAGAYPAGGKHRPVRRAGSYRLLGPWFGLLVLTACQPGLVREGASAETRSRLEAPAPATEPTTQTVEPERRAPAASTTPPGDTASAPGQSPAGGDRAPVTSVALRSRSRAETARATRSGQVAPEQNQFYDKNSPAFALLQKANESLAGFPVGRVGEVDWMKALHTGLIKPRADRTGQGEMRVLDKDIVMKHTREMPYVLFPHRSHTEWLACSNCHEGIFVSKAGANSMDMNAIFRGRFCGVCHDKVAFSTYACERCHSLPQPGASRAP
jgi:c(7)-type cytochrome triheme protein